MPTPRVFVLGIPIFLSTNHRAELGVNLSYWPKNAGFVTGDSAFDVTTRNIPEVAILGGKRTSMVTSCSVFGCHDRRIQGSNIRF